jgi:hypothetical protein
MADTHQPPVAKRSGTSMLANALAIAGSIILVVIIIWGLIHLLSLSGGFFSSLFGNKSEGITVNAPSDVTSGRTFNISWQHETDDTGMYALLYPCTEGLRFSTRAPNNALITMPCGAAFAVGNATTSAMITPLLTSTTTVNTPFSILFIPRSTSTRPVEGTVTLAVKPAPAPLPEPEQPKPEPRIPLTPPPTGPGDLAVTITSVSVDQFGNGTAIFHISNVGKGASGSYMFTAQLPTRQPYTYVSQPQASLAPGAYIVNTLRFTQAIAGNVTVIVDPANSVRESNEGNNTASQYISGQYQTNSGYPVQPSSYNIYNYPYTY